MKSRKGFAAAALALLVLTLGACTTEPIKSGEPGELDGVWMFIQTRISWTEDGFPEKDTVNYDTSSAFARQFYLVRDGLIFWVEYDPYEEMGTSRFAPISKIGKDKWVLGGTDTATITLAGNSMTVAFSDSFAEYSPWLEDSVYYSFSSSSSLVRYTRAFPPPEWYEPAPTESEPNDARATANTLEVGGRPLVAFLDLEDTDWYAFPAVQGQAYLIRTYGSTDTYMELFRGATLLSDNDDFEENNAGFYWVCELSGTYHLRVRGYAPMTVGGYSVGVSAVTDIADVTLKPAAKKNGLRKHPLQQPTTK